MDTKDLIGFVQTCKEGSISKAAKRLYLSPQGLSRNIRQLEEELDTILLIRKTNGIELTASGELFYNRAQSMLRNYHTTLNELHNIDNKDCGSIELISAYGILRLITPEEIMRFQKENPKIPFSYTEYPDRIVESHFANKEGNIALSIAPFSQNLFDATEIVSFPLSVIVNVNHPLANKKIICVKDLQEEEMILESDVFKVNQIVTEACEEIGFTPDIVFQTSGFSLCNKVVERGPYISVVVDDIYEQMSNNNIIKIPFEECLQWKICMLTRKGEYINPSIHYFKEFVLRLLSK